MVALLAEVALGLGSELIAFIGGVGGAIFGVGATVGAARKRLEAAEVAVLGAAAECRVAAANTIAITDLQRRMTDAEKSVREWRDRTKAAKELVESMRNGLRQLLTYMKHGEGVPKQVLDDISEVLNVPRARREESSG